MSEEHSRVSPRRPLKSPSRIPVFSSIHKKRPAPIVPETRSNLKSPSVTPVNKALIGFRRLEALAKAETKNLVSREQPAKVSGNPWVEKHLPQSLEDLFVHKKKLEEVINWLERAFATTTAKTNKICVLNGPAGCGKTASIFLVAKQLEADIKEWLNPMSLTDRTFVPGDYEARRDEVQFRSELDLFKDFLEINSHYRFLPINGKRMKRNRVIVVEDLPNGLYRDPGSFHEILRNYSRNGTFPVVFIFSDTVNSDHSMYKMFPKQLMTELHIHNISFNPVAATLMVKFLLNICTKESKPIDKSQVEEIAATANGDLRCAINNLQFFLTRERGFSSKIPGGFRKPPPKRSRKSTSHASATSQVQQKDDTIQLFKALGKVLYAKRDETVVSEVEMQLEGELELERRLHPLLEDPDNIAMKIEVSADMFLGFLHQNYPAFYGSMDDLRVAAEYLSHSDFILSGWKFDDSGTRAFRTRDTNEQVSMNIAIRGLMHSNNNRVSVGWKPLTKPLISNLTNHTRDCVESTRQSLYHLRELQTTLFTEAIPFYAKLLQRKPQCMIEGRKEILEKGIFKGHTVRAESLDEREAVEDSALLPDSSEDSQDQESEEVVNKDLVSKENVKSDSEEEFSIEEYAD